MKFLQIQAQNSFMELCGGLIIMAVSYKKLWHLLLDKNMKKKDLQKAADLTQYAMLKLGRDEDVSTEILGKICQALDCSPEDIMEFLPND